MSRRLMVKSMYRNNTISRVASPSPPPTSNNVPPSPRTTEGSDIRMVRRNTLAIVARHAFKMTFPVSARVLLEIDDIFEGGLVTHDRADELQAVRFGKNQQGFPCERAIERLLHGNQLVRVASFHESRSPLARHDVDGRHREQDTFAHHLTQAVGGAADAHVGKFRKRIMLDARQLTYARVHLPLSRDEVPRRTRRPRATRPSKA